MDRQYVELIKSGSVFEYKEIIQVQSRPKAVCHVKCLNTFFKSKGRLAHLTNAFILSEDDWGYSSTRSSIKIKRKFKSGFIVVAYSVKTIRSLYMEQQSILFAILKLNNLKTFDLDFTYGNGMFYREIPKPRYRFDLDGNLSDVVQADSKCIPVKSKSISSAMFDPPFLTYVKAARQHAGGKMIMSSRFGGYWAYRELEEHYRGTIEEAARVLKSGGIFVVKCQDIIHNHKMHSTHINVVNWAENWFRLKDYFILGATHRMPNRGKQNHSRSFHSYFLVLERNKEEVGK